MVDLGEVHHRVGRLIKVYVAYLKALSCCVIMLSAKVSGRREGWRGWHRQCCETKSESGKMRVEWQDHSADELGLSLLLPLSKIEVS